MTTDSVYLVGPWRTRAVTPLPDDPPVHLIGPVDDLRPLCVVAVGGQQPPVFAATPEPGVVTCRACIEWMHA